MKNPIYATILSLLFKAAILLGSLNSTYAVVPPALADTPPRHPLTVAQIYAVAPILRPIFACESTGDASGTPRQFNADGSILWGQEADPVTGKTIIVKRDVGEAQINTWVHAAEIKAQGLDVENNEWDNVWFGYELWLQNGTQPWIASKATCWGK